MAFLTDQERHWSEILERLSFCNPFLSERIELERQALGEAFNESDLHWHKRADEVVLRPNLTELTRRTHELAESLRSRLLERAAAPSDREVELYETVGLYFIYNKYERHFYDYILEGADAPVPFHAEFMADLERFFGLPGMTFRPLAEVNHTFACFFQLRRAFHHIFDNIIGGSSASARLRAAVWQSVFTRDMKRYRRALFDRLGDVTTLITGPSGTGKELVARAVGLSRYVPFDPKTKRFHGGFSHCFYPINLSALSPTLIESEMFGHAKGAFTGAVADRTGFLQMCPAHGAVFLDEIGELQPAIQVKLLRVLQTREFQRVGEAQPQRFLGKVVAATNRDLEEELRAGRFRKDLYYRLCSDVITTPTLKEQLADAPEQRRNLLLFLCTRVAGEEEAPALTDEVGKWIDEHLPADHDWPGNVRELEQCVRNVMVHGTYRPRHAMQPAPDAALREAVESGSLTADELLREYCALVYRQTGSYVGAARRLGLDRRTVKSQVDRANERDEARGRES